MSKKQLFISGLILATLLGVYGITSTENSLMKATSQAIKNEISKKSQKDLKISAEIILDSFKLEIFKEKIDIESKDYTLKSADFSINSREGALQLMDFEGSLIYDGQFIIEGTAEKIKDANNLIRISDKIILNSDDANILIENAGLNIKNTEALEHLTINEKIKLDLDNDLSTLIDFNGRIKLNNNHLILGGSAQNLYFKDSLLEVELK